MVCSWVYLKSFLIFIFTDDNNGNYDISINIVLKSSNLDCKDLGKDLDLHSFIIALEQSYDVFQLHTV